MGFGLRCDACGGCETRVVETRSHPGMVIRKRRCSCGESFLTYEVQVDALVETVTTEPLEGGSARKVWRVPEAERTH